MKRPYARRRWLRILRELSAGRTVPEICRTLKIDPSYVYRKLRLARREVERFGRD